MSPEDGDTVTYLQDREPSPVFEELDTITAKVSPTYPEIKAYVLEHHGLKVSSLAIAQTKNKTGDGSLS